MYFSLSGGCADGSGFTGLCMVSPLPRWPVSKTVAYIQNQEYKFLGKYRRTRWGKKIQKDLTKICLILLSCNWRVSVLGRWEEVSSLQFAPYFWAWTAKTCWRTLAISCSRLDLGLLVRETGIVPKINKSVFKCHKSVIYDMTLRNQSGMSIHTEVQLQGAFRGRM